MVNMREIWAPIVISSALTFVASSVIWMFLGYHKSDMASVTDEEALRETLRKQNLAPGQYGLPWSTDQKQRATPEFKKKMIDGPLANITIRPAGSTGMGKVLGQWFLYLLILNSVIAYAAGRTLPHGLSYLTVFRAVGTISFLAYGGSTAVSSIFWGRPWKTTAKDLFDAFLYACLAAGSFGWLWPR